ncbi:hypothetical protein UlMin_037051 [Ulmus minor]
MENTIREDLMIIDLNEEPLLDLNLRIESEIEQGIRQLEVVSSDSNSNSNSKTKKRNSTHLIAQALVEADRVEDHNKNKKKKHVNPNRNGNEGFFDCRICFNMPIQPVLTSCGHMFCWTCFFHLPYAYSTAKECPVCTGEVTDMSIVPIYGNGNGKGNGNGIGDNTNLKAPPRPRARRVDSSRQQQITRGLSASLEERIRQLTDIVGRLGERSSPSSVPPLSQQPPSFSTLSSTLNSAMDYTQTILEDLEANNVARFGRTTPPPPSLPADTSDAAASDLAAASVFATSVFAPITELETQSSDTFAGINFGTQMEINVAESPSSSGRMNRVTSDLINEALQGRLS